MSRTIEVISRHTGTINAKVKGENRKIHFEQRRPGIGIAAVDSEEAAALLVPGLEKDFWKERVEAETIVAPPEKDEKKGEAQGKDTKVSLRKVAEIIADIEAAETIEAVDALTAGDKRPTVLSAAEVKKEELTETAEGKAGNGDPQE